MGEFGGLNRGIITLLLAGGSRYIIDIVCAAVLLVFTFSGARKGAICSVIGFFSTVISLTAAYYLAVPVANVLDGIFSVYGKIGVTFWYVVSGIIVFIICKILLALFARFLTRLARSVRVVGAANTLFGALLGFLKALLIICAVLAVISILPDSLSFAAKADSAIDGTLVIHTIRDHNPLLKWLLRIIERAKMGA